MHSETFKLSTDPLFVDKVQDIVGLYMPPPNRAVVLCVDEKSQIQALDREQLQRGVHRSTAEREADITVFIAAHNENPRPYKWVKSADEILASVKRFSQKTMHRTSDPGE